MTQQKSEEKGIPWESIQFSLRWILPGSFMIFCAFYQRDIQWIKGNFDEIKSTLQEIKSDLRQNSKEHEDIRLKLGGITNLCCGEISERQKIMLEERGRGGG